MQALRWRVACLPTVFLRTPNLHGSHMFTVLMLQRPVYCLYYPDQLSRLGSNSSPRGLHHRHSMVTAALDRDGLPSPGRGVSPCLETLPRPA
ncbi:hypothetical protein F4780DRAFT_57000 [Xylariomycetidae sp. FL0641]|nr:hypothetical protein F4780DRAFT_57000 [Xylariomycetidae sp. FL0641]